MKLSNAHEALLSLAISLIVIGLVLRFGDALYIGIWYYIAVPVFAYLLGSFFKPVSLFQTGNSLGVAILFLFYLNINWQATRPEGLLGLGHLFSLPGAAIGICLSAFLLKRKKAPSFIIAFCAGLFGVVFGFFLNQIIVCNTVMWCGPLSIK